MKLEWNQITVSLKLLKICREGLLDKIVWSWKMKAGNIMVANIYNTLYGREAQHGENHVLYALWKTKIPIKIILFS